MSSSSSNNFNLFRGTKKSSTIVERDVNCECGIAARCWEAWKDGTCDPGRKFFGCSRFKDPRLNCNFFKWVDPPYTERARGVIEEMKINLTIKVDEVKLLCDNLKAAEKDVYVLKDELEEAKKKNKEATDLLMKKHNKLCRMKRL